MRQRLKSIFQSLLIRVPVSRVRSTRAFQIVLLVSCFCLPLLQAAFHILIYQENARSFQLLISSGLFGGATTLLVWSFLRLVNRAEKALRENEIRFRQMADAMPQLVWTALPDGRIDYYNQRSGEYLGLTPLSDGAWPWAPTMHPDDLSRVQTAARQALDQKIKYQVEYRAAMADGSYRWHLSRGIPVIDESGQVTRWYGTATDIHDIKQTLAALHDREDWLQLAIQAANLGTWKYLYEPRLFVFDEHIARMFGVANQQVGIDEFMSLVYPPDAAELLKAFDDTKDPTSQPHHYTQYRIQHPKLGLRWMEAQAEVYFEGEGERSRVLMAVGTCLDITDRKQAQEEHDWMNRELVRSNHELDQFASIISHDLQEPLRGITGMVSILKRNYGDQLDQQGRHLIDLAIDACARMQGQIDALLEYGRVSTRGKPFELVNADTALHAALANLDLQVQERRVQISAGVLPQVFADYAQLVQLFQNLIQNAIKFCNDPQPQVQIHAEQLAEGWQFSVRDNGIGIDPQNFARIFVIFQRLHNRSEYLGSGIGLAICKRIVERHGGNIWVESQPGQGSTFYFTIPAIPIDLHRQGEL